MARCRAWKFDEGEVRKCGSGPTQEPNEGSIILVGTTASKGVLGNLGLGGFMSLGTRGWHGMVLGFVSFIVVLLEAVSPITNLYISSNS